MFLALSPQISPVADSPNGPRTANFRQSSLRQAIMTLPPTTNKSGFLLNYPINLGCALEPLKMNKAEKEMIFELLVEGLTVLAGGDKKALERLGAWAEDRRKTVVYLDGRAQAWTLERRAKHSEAMRSTSPYCYRLEVYNIIVHGGGKLTTLYFDTPEEVAFLMGMKVQSLRCQLSAARGKLTRDIHHLPTVTEKIPRVPTLKFTQVNMDKKESLIDILVRQGVLDKNRHKILANTPRGRSRGRPSALEGEFPLPGRY